MNKVFLLGNLGKEPDIRTTQTGKMVTSFSIGVHDGKDKPTQWFNIITWEKLATYCGDNLHKGSRVLVEGKITQRSYDAKDGTKKYITEIIANSVQNLTPKQTGQPADAATTFGGHDVAPDEEIPF